MSAGPSTHPRHGRSTPATRLDALRNLASGFAKTQPAEVRTGMGMDGAPTAKRAVATLPLDEVRGRLEAHPVVRARRVDVGKVHACLVELLVVDSVPKRSKHTPAPRRPPPTACCGAEPCVDADRSAHVCSACGLVLAAFLSDETPHRYFAEDRYNGKADPNHWVRTEEDEPAWAEVEWLQPHAFVGRATTTQADEVRRRLEAYSATRSVANRIVAAAAAWILVENPAVLTDRRVGMTEADLPIPPFACRECSAAFHQRRDLRFHSSRCWTAA